MFMKTKDRRGNRPPLTPPYPRRGIAGLPSSDEEGLGVVGLCILRAHFALVGNWVSEIEKWRNKARMSMKTKEEGREVEELRSRGVEKWKDQEPTAKIAVRPQAGR